MWPLCRFEAVLSRFVVFLSRMHSCDEEKRIGSGQRVLTAPAITRVSPAGVEWVSLLLLAKHH